VLVAGGDDHALEALCRRIATWPTIEIVGWARSTQQARSLVEALAAEVVVMDVEAPAFGGPEAIRSVETAPGAPILLVLTSEDTPNARIASFGAGADGFVTKRDPDKKLRALFAAIRPCR
jgi:DNA-binding NarL/FixJ family response regulator